MPWHFEVKLGRLAAFGNTFTHLSNGKASAVKYVLRAADTPCLKLYWMSEAEIIIDGHELPERAQM